MYFRGEGLGKDKSGRSSHISVTVKNDKKGIASGNQDWDFAWWDHLYNKNASNVVIAKDEKNEACIPKDNAGSVLTFCSGQSGQREQNRYAKDRYGYHQPSTTFRKEGKVRKHFGIAEPRQRQSLHEHGRSSR